jgi:Spy/CpxP family protein refolding chaperone
MKRLSLLVAISLLAVAAPAAAEPKDGPGGNPVAHGIPDDVAHKLGLTAERQHQIGDAVFEANRALIDLDATQKKAQMDLEKELRAQAPDEAKVMQLVAAVGQAEIAVRKNRLGLQLKTRKLLGPELWERVLVETGSVKH